MLNCAQKEPFAMDFVTINAQSEPRFLYLVVKYAHPIQQYILADFISLSFNEVQFVASCIVRELKVQLDEFIFTHNLSEQ